MDKNTAFLRMQNDSLIEKIAKNRNVFFEIAQKDLQKEFCDTTEYTGIEEELLFMKFLHKEFRGMVEVSGTPNYIFPPKEFKVSDNEMFIRVESNDKNGKRQSFAIHLWRDSEGKDGNNLRIEMIQL